MADMMTFPNKFEDFIHEYEFDDVQWAYTNGSELIQSFRVMQAWEHYMDLFRKAYQDSNGDMHMLGHYTKYLLKQMGELNEI